MYLQILKLSQSLQSQITGNSLANISRLLPPELSVLSLFIPLGLRNISTLIPIARNILCQPNSPLISRIGNFNDIQNITGVICNMSPSEVQLLVQALSQQMNYSLLLDTVSILCASNLTSAHSCTIIIVFWVQVP